MLHDPKWRGHQIELPFQLELARIALVENHPRRRCQMAVAPLSWRNAAETLRKLLRDAAGMS